MTPSPANGEIKAGDGGNTCIVAVPGGWDRGEIMLVGWWVDGAQQQIGYKKANEGAFTKGELATYSDVSPGTHMRFGHETPSPVGFLQSQMWSLSSETKVINLITYAD